MLILACLLSCVAGPPASSFAAPATNAPLDWRHQIPAAAFQKTGALEWTSPLAQPPFAFEELIYSWHVQRPGDTFRLYLKAAFGPGDETDWLYAGDWGAVKDAITNRARPTFDRGTLDMDWLKLTAKASGFRFKVVSAGATLLATPPALTVVATDNHPPASSAAAAAGAEAPRSLVLDVPLRRQLNSQGQWIKDRCQSAALASAMDTTANPCAWKTSSRSRTTRNTITPASGRESSAPPANSALTVTSSDSATGPPFAAPFPKTR